MDKGMYYFELYFIVSPSLINRRFLLPFDTVAEAVAWVEKIKADTEGYYMRWKSAEEVAKMSKRRKKEVNNEG